MRNHSLVRGLAVAASLAASVVIGLAALVLAFIGRFDAFFLTAILGGLAIALMIVAGRRSEPAPVAVPDPFSRDLSSLDIVNIAHIRVAGIGGFALLLVAAAMVFEYQLVAAVTLAGFVGGTLGGVALILYRRARLRM